MSRIEPYRDPEGRLCARSADPEAALADYFETDVRENPDMCEALRTALAQVRNGERKSEEISGNLYRAQVTAEGVTIVNQYDDDAPGYRLSLQGFAEALSVWEASFDSQTAPP